jgi:UDP-glucose 4-epimerase
MAVLLTGGAGFIGSHTCVELLAAGRDVVVADNFSNSKPVVLDRIRKISGRDFVFYETDLRDADGLRRIFAENDIDAVIHFAGLKAVGESVAKPLYYYSHNLTVTFELCKAMREAGCGVMVFSSSATVYGQNGKMPLGEDSPLGPTTNPYGETKLMQERIITDLQRAGELRSAVLLRYFNPIGAHPSGLIGEDPNGIPNNLLPYISQVAVGKLPYVKVYGNDYPTRDGTGVRDYIHVVDLARAHLKALDYAARKSCVRAFNIGTGTGYSVLDVIKAFRDASGKKVPYRTVHRRPGDVAECYADPSLAAHELRWKAEYGLSRMCEDAYRWQSMNPRGYEEQ